MIRACVIWPVLGRTSKVCPTGAGVLDGEQCDANPASSGVAHDDDDPSQQISLSIGEVWKVEVTASISLS